MPSKVNTAEITDAYATDFANNFLSTLRPVEKSFFKVGYLVCLASQEEKLIKYTCALELFLLFLT